MCENENNCSRCINTLVQLGIVEKKQMRTSQQIEIFKGDGQQRTFTLGYVLDRAPIVIRKADLQTVGLKGLDPGCNFYWAEGENTLTQDSKDIPVEGHEDLVVVYIGRFDVLCKS